MNRIILIGNGFDLAHGLKTSYKDFIEWYWRRWGNKLRMSHEVVEKDMLCSFKLRDSHYDWFNTWYINQIITILDHPDDNDLVEIAKYQPELCDFSIKSPFFEEICRDVELKGWVDIENVYYRLLFPPVRSGSSPYSSNPCKLNEELDFIRFLLIEYLKNVQDNFTTKNIVKEDVKRKLYAPIRSNNISISAMPEWRRFVRERFPFDSETRGGAFYDLEELLKDYEITEIKEIKGQIMTFFNSYHDQITYMGMDSIPDDIFPDYSLLPDRIMLLNFNYTALADAYMLKNERFIVNHIHGKLDEPGSVIFGYGDEIDERYKALLEKNDNEYLRNIKSIKYLESPNYRNLLQFIESAPYQVFIMGHSCGNSDRTMLNTLFEHRNCVSIKPFYHKWDDGTDNYMELVQNISRNFTDMKLMRDRVVNKTFCETI